MPTDIRTGPPRPTLLPEHYRGIGPATWCVIGTAYGYLHRTDGTIRTWNTRSGAAKAAKRYATLHGTKG